MQCKEAERPCTYVPRRCVDRSRALVGDQCDLTCARLSRSGTRSRRTPAPKPPGAQMLAPDERSFEIPRLTSGFMVQAGIEPRNEFKFVRKRFYVQCCSQCGLIEIGYVAILFRHS